MENVILENIEDIYELSPMQQGMLFHTLYEPESGIYFSQLSYPLQGGLDVEAFRSAWQQVLDRHPILRTSFQWDDIDKPLQIVHRRVELPFERQDWRRLSDAEQQERLDAYLKADRLRGFSLSEPPLMRVAVIRLTDHAYQIVWSHHHLLMDGWSVPLLLEEWSARYEAACLGQELHLEPARPYSEFIAWLQGQDLSAAETFWRRALRGFAAPTPLGVDRPNRPGSEPDDRYEREHIWLPAATTAALRGLASQHQLTLNTLVQGAWGILLSRYSGSQDVVFGAIVSGREATLPGVESMIGLFINTLPVRVRVSAQAPLVPWLKELQARQFEARQYDYAPLVQIQGWSEVPRGLPLFESILAFENYPALGAAGEDREDESHDTVLFRATDRTNYPLAVMAAPGSQMPISIDYNRDRFDQATIMRMLGHLRTLLEAIATQPARYLSELPLLTEAERHQLLVEWNDTTTDYPRQLCVNQLFEAQVEAAPGAVAVICDDQQLTYQELNSRANQLAHHLRGLGVRPESLVGICMERSPEMVVGLLGILKAGGAYVPLDPTYPKERLAFMIEDTSVPVLLTQEHLLRQLPPTRARLVCPDTGWDAIASTETSNPISGARPDNLAYVIYTSGSTGRPKGVSVVHRGVVRLVKGTNYADFTAADVFLQLAPISFDASTFEIWGCLLNGGRLVLFPASTPSLEELGQILERHRITTLWLTSGLFHQMVENDIEALRPLRQLLAGGDVLSVSHVNRVLESLPGCQLINGYGPTENTTFTCCFPVTKGQKNSSVPVGRPISNTQVYILDRFLQPVPVGVPGELYVGGEGLARGYLNRPELTRQSFIPHPFDPDPGARLYRTGDLARYLPDGNVEFLGRRDHQVKIRGFRVELGEIEAALGQHPGVEEAVVLAREDLPGDRRLVAYLTARQDAPAADELRAFLNDKLPHYMLPSAFVVLDALPLTPNGKVDRRSLVPPDSTRPELPKQYVAPATTQEMLLARIWAEVLGTDRVGIHDNFFELGGDSILSIQIIARANQAGLRLTPKQFFQHPTISELVEVADTAPAVQAEQGVVTGNVPLTPVQHWFFEQGLPDPHHFNQALLMELPSSTDPVLLERAVQHLLEHHDGLRLRFERAESGWRQLNAGAGEPVPLVEVDLSGLPKPEQEAVLEQGAARLQASLNLSAGPLVRLGLFRLGSAGSDLLLIAIHHLVVDTVSWSILLEDFGTAYQQLSESKAVKLPPKTTSFQQWARRLEEHARSAAVRKELDYWLALPTGAVPLPRDRPEERHAVTSSGAVITSLGTEETRALLKEVPAAYQTEINDALLTALTQAFAGWSGTRSLLVDLEGHGREALFGDLDLSRTVGWFTMITPVLLNLGTSIHPGEALKAIKEQLRSIPNRGIGYGLLRYLSGDPEIARQLQALPHPEVSFNYLGQLSRGDSEASGSGARPQPIGPSRSPQGNRAHLLDVDAHVAGGRLEVEWTYCQNCHDRSTIESIARGFLEALRSLIAHCQSPEAGGYTPSDFSKARLSQKDLDEFLERLGQGKD